MVSLVTAYRSPLWNAGSNNVELADWTSPVIQAFVKKVPGRCEEIGCHAERSGSILNISRKTNKCAIFLASLGMTGLGDSFTPS